MRLKFLKQKTLNVYNSCATGLPGFLRNVCKREGSVGPRRGEPRNIHAFHGAGRQTETLDLLTAAQQELCTTWTAEEAVGLEQRASGASGNEGTPRCTSAHCAYQCTVPTSALCLPVHCANQCTVPTSALSLPVHCASESP